MFLSIFCWLILEVCRMVLVSAGRFILYFGSESMNREGTSNQESEITMKDTEEVAEIINYIIDKF
jgi:adenylate cyclase class IV